MKIGKICISMLLVSVLTSALYADGFDYYAHINKYVKCEAVQNVMANITSESEQEFYQHELHHASLDSRMIAMEFARVGKYKQGLVDELYHTYLDEYRSELKKNEEVEEFVAALKPQVKKCQRLNEMQSDIISRKKQQAVKKGNYLQ